MNHSQAKKFLALFNNLSFIDKLHIYIRLRRPFLKAAAKYVPKKGTILDFGCGHGLFSILLAQQSSRRNITAFDISKRKINIAKRSNHPKNITFIHSNHHSAVLKRSKQYDVIVVLNVLYLLPRTQQIKIIKTFNQLLNKNGRLIITEQDNSFIYRTLFTQAREFAMVRIFKLTKGSILTFNSHHWWTKVLHKHFKKIKIANIDKNEFQKLYLCFKNPNQA